MREECEAHDVSGQFGILKKSIFLKQESCLSVQSG